MDTYKVSFRIGDWVNYIDPNDDAIGQVIEIRDYRSWSNIPYLLVQYPGHVHSCHADAYTFVRRDEL